MQMTQHLIVSCFCSVSELFGPKTIEIFYKRNKRESALLKITSVTVKMSYRMVWQCNLYGANGEDKSSEKNHIKVKHTQKPPVHAAREYVLLIYLSIIYTSITAAISVQSELNQKLLWKFTLRRTKSESQQNLRVSKNCVYRSHQRVMSMTECGYINNQ